MAQSIAAPPRRQLLNVDQAADFLGTTPRHIRDLWARRELPGIRLGSRAIRFEPDALEAWFDAHRVGAVR